MTFSKLVGALCAAFAVVTCALPVHAGSSASSASSAGSASSGSVSDSISSSSDSSGGDERVAAGRYEVIHVAAAPGKRDTTRLTLRAVDMNAAQFNLDVPNQVLAARAMQQGDLVDVKERVYGYEFAHADTQRAFFLALEDNWFNDLRSRKVVI